MKLNRLLFSIFTIVSFAMVSCEEDTAGGSSLSANHVSFMKMPANVVIPVDETVEVEGKVYASTTSNMDRVIELRVVDTAINSATLITTADPDYFSVPASVTIPAGEKMGTFNVSITGVGLGAAGKLIVVEMVAQDGIEIPSYFSGSYGLENYEALSERLVIKAVEGCFENPFRVEMRTDRYGEETSWELYDSTMTLIGSGGPYQRLSANGTFDQDPVNFCLEDGNYTFIVLDSYGDGMDSGAGNGYYRLVKTVDGVEVEIAKNGVFGAFEEVMFTLP